MAGKTVFPSYLSVELDPNAAQNLQRYEQKFVSTYARIENSAKQSGARIQRQGLTPNFSGVAASRAAAVAQEQAARATRRHAGEAANLNRRLAAENRSLNETSIAARRAAGALDQTAASLTIVQGPLGPLAGRVTAVATALRSMTAGAFLGAAAGALTFAFAGISTGLADVRSQLRPLFDEQGDLNDALDDTARIAVQTRTALAPTAELYAKLTRVGREYNLEQARVARLTETVAKAARLSGGTPEAREAAITQLGQALGSGVLQGDELRSIRENASVLAKAIADGLGVQVGQLKALGEQGALTTQTVVAALERSSAKIDEQAKKISATLPVAFRAAATQATVYFGRIDQAAHATETLAAIVLGLADNFGTLATVVTAVAVGNMAKFIGKSIESQRVAASVGTAIQGTARQAAASAAAQVAAAESVSAGLVEQRAQLLQNIALIERQRAAAVATLELNRGIAAAGGAANVGGAQADANLSTRALIASRRALRRTDAELAAAEIALAEATRVSAAATAALPQRVGLARRSLGLLKSAGSGVLSLFGGTWGAVFALAAGAVYYFSTQMSDAERATKAAKSALDDYGRALDQTTGKLRAMSAQERETLKLNTARELSATAAEAREVTARISRRVAIAPNPFLLDNDKRLQFQRDRREVVGYADDIAAGGARAKTAFTALENLRAKGNLAASEVLKESAEDIETMLAIGERQATARRLLNLASGGTDPKVAERNAQAEADFAANAKIAGDELERQIKAANTLGDNDKFQKNLAHVFETLAGEDIVKNLESARVRLAKLKELSIPKGQDDERAAAIAATETELARLEKRYRALEPAARDYAKRLTDAQNAERDHNQAVRAGESDLKKQLRTKEQIADAEQRIANIRAGYDEAPGVLDRARRDIGRLRDLVGQPLADGATLDFTAGDLDVETQRIMASIRREAEKTTKERENQYRIDRLILAGRDREAAYLEAKLQFQEKYGSALELERLQVEAIRDGRLEEADILKQQIVFLKEMDGELRRVATQGVDEADRARAAQRLISIYESVPQALQQGFESVWDNIDRRGIKSAKDLLNVFTSTFRRLQGQFVSNFLFGDIDAEIRKAVAPRVASSVGLDAGSLATTAAGLIGGPRASPSLSPGFDPGPLVDLNSTTVDAIDAQKALTTATIRSADVQSDAARATVQAMESAAGAIGATGQAVSAAATAAARAAGVPGAVPGQAAPVSAVDAYNILGKKIGDKLDRLFGTAGKAGAPGMLGRLGSNLGTGLGYYSAASVATDALGIHGAAGGAIKGAALGFGLAGPWGALAGAIVGGLSKAFAKTQRSSATIRSSGGAFGETSVRGTSDSRREAAGSLADTLEDRIEYIVDQLDAEIGDLSLSIGTRKKKFVVDPTGRGRTKGAGVLKFDTEEEALAKALDLALQRGVVKGVSAASDRILRSGQDIEKALKKVSLIESVPKRLLQLTDPVRFAVTELNDQFNELIDAMLEGGATAEQIADAEKLYNIERKNAIEQAKSAQSDVIDRFLTNLSSGSDSPFSRADTYKSADAALDVFRKQIDAGEAVDEEKLVDALQNFYDATRELNGSRGAAFADIAEIKTLGERARAITQTGAEDAGPLPGSPFEEGPRASQIDRLLSAGNDLNQNILDAVRNLPRELGGVLEHLTRGRTGGLFGPGAGHPGAIEYLPSRARRV